MTKTHGRAVTGVLTAVLTPMHDDLRANAALLVRHSRRLLDAGCSGLVLLGTTGEANSFTIVERQAILEDVLAGGIAGESLIVGTGCCAIDDTVALTSHALSAGVTRVLVLPPFYYKNVSDDGLFDAFAAIIERVGDDRLRVFLYLIPQMTGVEMQADLVERLHASFPTIIAGLKDSSGDWPATEALCRRLGAKIDVMVGTEALMLRAMAAGASGCITAMANIAAPAIIQLWSQRQTPHAAALEKTINAMRKGFAGYSFIPALKAYLADATGASSWRNVRPPLRALTPDESLALRTLGDVEGAISIAPM